MYQYFCFFNRIDSAKVGLLARKVCMCVCFLFLKCIYAFNWGKKALLDHFPEVYRVPVSQHHHQLCILTFLVLSAQ